MPDRHGPLKVVYQERGQGEEIPSTNWTTFEDQTPNDILDRITRGILQTDPQWLGEVLTPTEITAVEGTFGVTIAGPGADPSDRFRVEGFGAFFTDQELSVFEAAVIDDDDDDDLTEIELSATDANGLSGSTTRSADGTASQLAFFEANPFGPEASPETPITATLSAADTDSGGEFVELVSGDVDPNNPFIVGQPPS